MKEFNPLIDWDKGTLKFDKAPKEWTPEPAKPEMVPQSTPRPKKSAWVDDELEDSPNDLVIATLQTSDGLITPDGISLKEGDIVFSYVPKEKTFQIYSFDSPLARDPLEKSQSVPLRIGRLVASNRSSPHRHYSLAKGVWIQLKTNPSMELAQRAHAKDILRKADETVPTIYHEFLDVFEKKAAKRMPDHRPYDHAIDLKPDFIPKSSKVYPLSPREQEALDAFLSENLRKGYIVLSNSPMASPFFFVAKKDGTLRPCQDYCYLNSGTVRNAYPLPLISELVDQLEGATVFSKLDICAGYNNVHIKEGDQWKAAFKCSKGLFEPTVMFFGLCNSPATFQAMMNDLFGDMIDKGWLLIYMDDMLIFSKDITTHQERTRRVLQHLRDHDLFLKAEKCVFEATEVEFLGMVICPGVVAMDPVKLNGIRDWPAPTTVRGV